MRAQMDGGLGIGATSVVINGEALQKKTDRIELAMTAAEVKDTISRQRQGQGQKPE